MEKVVPETIIVKASKHGKGIFTTTSHHKNSSLFQITGTPITFAETLNMGNNQCYCLQIDLEEYLLPAYPFLFSNHSCNPNCAINEKLEFITLRDIAAGEELVWDYSTSMLERNWTMKCDCNSHNCRKIVADFDLLPSFLQIKYLEKKVVLPFIVNYLISCNSQTPVISIAPSVLGEAQIR